MSQRNAKSAPTSEMEGVSRWLIHHAACRAPESLSQRLEEEWLADWAERPTAMSRLRFALGCCWATQVIALEYRPSKVPVTSSVMEAKPMIAYAQHDSGYFSRRSGTLFLVVSLHAMLFYGLVTALSHRPGSLIPESLQNQLLKDTRVRDLPPRLPDPLVKQMKIEVPIPDFVPPREPDPNGDVTADFVQHPTPVLPPSPPSPAHVMKQVQGGPGTGFPNPDDFYPMLARHMEEQGIATVRVCVDSHGRLTADPTTLQGSGSSRLDEGALKLARAGSGHYRATTEDGQPVSSCYPLRIRFQLKN